MLKIERQSNIIKYLETNQILSVQKIAEKLKCSEETIRKDLIELECQDKLTRTRGGAFLKTNYEHGFSNSIKQELLKKEKNYIANLALKHIKTKDLIMLDSSTTCIELARVISNKEVYVKIMTNSLDVANICSNSKNIDLILIGGEFHRNTNSFVGYHTTELLDMYTSDVSFVSFPTIDLGRGLGDNNLQNLMIRKTMLKNCKKSILLMDHTKFCDESAIIFSDIDNYNYIITDKIITDDWEKYMKAKNIKVEY